MPAGSTGLLTWVCGKSIISVSTWPTRGTWLDVPGALPCPPIISSSRVRSSQTTDTGGCCVVPVMVLSLVETRLSPISCDVNKARFRKYPSSAMTELCCRETSNSWLVNSLLSMHIHFRLLLNRMRPSLASGRTFSTKRDTSDRPLYACVMMVLMRSRSDGLVCRRARCFARSSIRWSRSMEQVRRSSKQRRTSPGTWSNLMPKSITLYAALRETTARPIVSILLANGSAQNRSRLLEPGPPRGPTVAALSDQGAGRGRNPVELV